VAHIGEKLALRLVGGFGFVFGFAQLALDCVPSGSVAGNRK
jgi:hypothetical protein